uniref:Uncharacterized protein n=1 Tax=Glossina pallidipes TaxID=7398 RepID=A0A1A9Z4D8_GLOPL
MKLYFLVIVVTISRGWLKLANIDKVLIIRNEIRNSLVRSRVRAGAAAVLTLFSNHIECDGQWLMDNFQHIGASDDLRVGFDCNLIFKWEHLSPTERGTRQHNPTTAIRTSMLASGLFNTDKAYFTKLSKYYITMDVCDGESRGISFRVGQCGCSLEIILCNRAGHVFRRRHPYTFLGDSGNVFARNTLRTAKTSMDEYKKYYRTAVQLAKNISFGRTFLMSLLAAESVFLQKMCPYIKHDDLCLTFEQFARDTQVAMSFRNETENQHWKVSEDGFIRHRKRLSRFEG